MNIIQENQSLKIIYDYLYWTFMLENQKQYWRSIRNKHADELNKNSEYKGAWEFLTGDKKNEYKKLLKTAKEQYDSDKSYYNYFLSLSKSNPELKPQIDLYLQKVKQYTSEMQFPLRYSLYKELERKTNLVKQSSPQENEVEIKKQLEDIYTVLNSVENKLSNRQQKIFYDIQSEYTHSNLYYSEAHVDALLNFYKSLSLPPVENMLAKIKSRENSENKKEVLGKVKYEDLGIKRDFEPRVKEVILDDVIYLQKATNQKVFFSEPGNSNKIFQGLITSNITPQRIKGVLGYADRLEDLTGQKVIFK